MGQPGPFFFGACMRKFVTSDPASAAASGSRCSAAGFIITPSYISDRISDRMPAATAASSKMHVEAGAGVDAKFKLDAKVSTPAIARLASPSSPCDSRAAATLRAADDASPLRPAADSSKRRGQSHKLQWCLKPSPERYTAYLKQSRKS